MAVSESEPLQEHVDDLEAEVETLAAARQARREALRAQHAAHLASLRQDLSDSGDFNDALRTQLRVRQQKNLRLGDESWKADLDRGLLLGLWLGSAIGCWWVLGPGTGLGALAVWPAVVTLGRRLSGRR